MVKFVFCLILIGDFSSISRVVVPGGLLLTSFPGKPEISQQLDQEFLDMSHDGIGKIMTMNDLRREREIILWDANVFFLGIYSCILYRGRL